MIHFVRISEMESMADEILQCAITQRPVQSDPGYINYPIVTPYDTLLYTRFYDACQRYYGPFELLDNNFRMHAFLTDNKFRGGGHYHDHVSTATYNAALYVSTVQGCGISFVSGQDQFSEVYYEPNVGDMYIFESHVKHKAHPSHNQKRLSLNLEIRAKTPLHSD